MNPDLHASRQQVLEFFANNPIGVLATADSQGRPHASTIYVTFDQSLNFYFVTKRDTKKAQHLATNPSASIAFYDTRSQTTIQVDGITTEVKDTDESNRIFNEIQNIARRTSTSATPPITTFSAGGYITYMLIAPSVRMAQFGNSDSNAPSSTFETVY